MLPSASWTPTTSGAAWVTASTILAKSTWFPPYSMLKVITLSEIGVGAGVGFSVAVRAVGVAATADDGEGDGWVVPQPAKISPIASAPIPCRIRTRSSSTGQR